MQNNSSFFTSVDNFVKCSGGDHTIKKILIANNGIGATKAIRSIRRWAFETFGNERAIKLVVMASPQDMAANAEFIRIADQVCLVPGGSNNNNYANVNIICEIAELYEVGAVMPMWGHASENPNLPSSLKKLNRRVSFIGPPAEPMQALGDKIGSTIIAQSAGVPVIAWNGDELLCDYKKEGISEELYAKANVTTPEDALICSDRIGYPVMIKASEGGGGKGIRKVLCPEEVALSYRQVAGEVPGSPIFIMKAAAGARHLEVQLLADKHGDAIALSGRDCSVQRRHQKIIEEGPPTAASVSVIAEMESAAVSLAKAVGYSSCGTVEYLFMEETNTFAFLELNPRLQVEHPVTENILGINLPACQLQVAMGLPLHRIGDIRKLYGRHPSSRDTIDFDYTPQVRPKRHCIAVRVTAENPECAFQPTSGELNALDFRSSVDVWGYFSVKSSGRIHEFADSQFGHIFASGTDREAARRAMVVALKELDIRGEIRTTIEYIIKLLQSEDFINNKIDTTWLDDRIVNHENIVMTEAHHMLDNHLVATCGTALEGFAFFKERADSFMNMLKMGQIPNRNVLSQSVDISLIYRNVKYSSSVVLSGETSIIINCNGESLEVKSQPLSDSGFLLTVNGQSHLAYTQKDSAGTLRLNLDGHTCIFPPEYDPTRLVSTVAGKIARLLVEDGTHLNVGDAFVEIEVMKMYMPQKAKEAGSIHYQMSEGASLSPGDVIATITLDDPDKIVQSEAFSGSLFDTIKCELNTESFTKATHVKMRTAKAKLDAVLRGFTLSEHEIEEALDTYFNCQGDKMLPIFEMDEALSILQGRIDQKLFDSIKKANEVYKKEINENPSTTKAYPSAVILTALQHFQTKSTTNRVAFSTQTASIWDVAERQIYPKEVRIIAVLNQFLEKYLEVETLFDAMSFTDVIGELRKTHQGKLGELTSLCRSHINLTAKNTFLLFVIDMLSTIKPPSSAIIKPRNISLRHEVTYNNRSLKKRLTDISKLRQHAYGHVAFAANLLLMKQYTVTTDHRRARLSETINSALSTGDYIGEGDRVVTMKKFAESNIAIHDLLIESLRADVDYQIAFIELYLRKVYQKTHILGNMTSGQGLTEGDASTWVTFDFVMRAPTSLESIRNNTTLVQLPDIVSNTNIDHNNEKPTSFFNIKKDGGTAIYSDSDIEAPEDTTIPEDSTNSGETTYQNRRGLFVSVDSMLELPSLFSHIVEKICKPITSTPSKPSRGYSSNAIYITLMRAVEVNEEKLSDDNTSDMLSSFLKDPQNTELLHIHGIRRVTFLVGSNVDQSESPLAEDIPSIFSFRENSKWAEDRLYRHIESPQAFLLDLQRLANFDISLEDGVQTSSGNVHLYKAHPHGDKNDTRRYFARLVSFTAGIGDSNTESLFVEALDHIAFVIGKDERQKLTNSSSRYKSSANHIFLNIVAPDSVVSADYYEEELRRISSRYSQKLVRLGIAHVEIKLTCRFQKDTDPIFMRLVASNPTGFVLKIDRYYEKFSEGQFIFKSLDSVSNVASAGSKSLGEWDGLPTTTPYSITEKFESQRAEALASSDTLYVYDWPLLFETSIQTAWETFVTPNQKER
jgi:biotin carboxylase/biotin carboxyl carrier protein